jgi:thiamine-monophosphate kinase
MDKSFSEDDLISLFRDITNDQSPLDDVGIVKLDGIKLAFNIDTFVKSSDAPPKMGYYSMGWKAVVSSISDLYVKGISPEIISISVGISSQDTEGLVPLSSGIKDATNKYKLRIVKWDTNSSRDLFISIASMGLVQTKIPWRQNLKEGDILVVSDYFGLEGLGLKVMLNKIKVQEKLAKAAIERFKRPSPNFERYIEIVRKGVHASTDSSDGLAKALWNLSRSSNRKIILTKLPIHPMLVEHSLSEEIRYETTLYGGEEYIGVFSIPSSLLKDAIKKRFIAIGKVTTTGIGVFNKDGKIIEDKGWVHYI